MVALVSVTLDPESILVWALIGLIAGFLASRVMIGHGLGLGGGHRRAGLSVQSPADSSLATWA